MSEALSHSRLDQLESSPRGSLSIKTHPQCPLIGRIVIDIDRGIELLPPRLGERLTFGMALAVEAVEGEEDRHGGDALGGQHHLVVTRLGVEGATALLGSS